VGAHITTQAQDAPATFLAERMWPGVTMEATVAEVERLALACEQMRQAGVPVWHLQSTLIQTDETVFNWFRAASAGDVAHVGRVAGVEFDRIVVAVAVPPAGPSPGG